MPDELQAGFWTGRQGGKYGGRGIVGGGLTLIGAPAVRRRCKVGDGGEIGGECGHHTLEDGVA